MDKTKIADFRDAQWHLSKNIPIALIIAVLGNMAAGIWFASKLDARLTNVETAIVAGALTDRRQYDLIAQERDKSQIGLESIARIEGQLVVITKLMERLLDKK